MEQFYGKHRKKHYPLSFFSILSDRYVRANFINASPINLYQNNNINPYTKILIQVTPGRRKYALK